MVDNIFKEIIWSKGIMPVFRENKLGFHFEDVDVYVHDWFYV